ncbi:MAG: 5'-nucleotidase [Candidatus Dormibacteraeota bacterium]|nr:5'-nucleotidase [Candidatus Dormibacteraeota bacterium]
MTEGQRFILGVDLDGVCADFYGGLRPIAAEWTGRNVEELPEVVSYALPEWNLGPFGGYEEMHRFAVTQRQLFLKLEPMPGCPSALRTLSTADIRIRIITHRLFIKYFHKEAIQQTVAWLDMFGIPYWDLCFMRDKAEVGANLYVEDAPANVEAMRKAGLTTLVFTNSTNLHLGQPRADSWAEVVDFVLKAREDWVAARS